MAIQPIDLQTMLMQMDVVGKQVAAAREGVALHQSVAEAQSAARLAEQAQSVNETANAAEDGMQGLKNEGKGPGDEGGGNAGKRSARNSSQKKPPDLQIISDPSLGRHIDIVL